MTTSSLSWLASRKTATVMPPAAVKHYLAAIETLAETVRANAAFAAESKAALRDLIATVTVHPAEAGTAPEISIEGHLTKMIGGDHFPTRKA